MATNPPNPDEVQAAEDAAAVFFMLKGLERDGKTPATAADNLLVAIDQKLDKLMGGLTATGTFEIKPTV